MEPSVRRDPATRSHGLTCRSCGEVLSVVTGDVQKAGANVERLLRLRLAHHMTDVHNEFVRARPIPRPVVRVTVTQRLVRATRRVLRP